MTVKELQIHLRLENIDACLSILSHHRSYLLVWPRDFDVTRRQTTNRASMADQGSNYKTGKKNKMFYDEARDIVWRVYKYLEAKGGPWNENALLEETSEATGVCVSTVKRIVNSEDVMMPSKQPVTDYLMHLSSDAQLGPRDVGVSQPLNNTQGWLTDIVNYFWTS